MNLSSETLQFLVGVKFGKSKRFLFWLYLFSELGARGVTFFNINGTLSTCSSPVDESIAQQG